MNSRKILYLIDGSAYIYRAYHAIRGLTTSKGLPTNASFGFVRILTKMIETQNPEYAAMFFDAKGPTLRHQKYADYKANRPPMPEDLVVQLPYIKKIVQGFRIPIFEESGYEADDLIGTLVRLAEEQGFACVMVTGDKDFMQLITPHAEIWDPMKDKTISLATIKVEYDLTPRQLIDVTGLSGDKADNVPGVPGIGPKTAVQLIQTFGSMENLYERIDTITKKKQRENLETFKAQALLSKELVTIDTHAPIAFDPISMKLTSPDTAFLNPLFQELEFRKLQKDLPKTNDLSNKNYQTVLDEEALTALADRLEKTGIFAFDTETTSENPMLAELVGLSFALVPHEAYYIPCAHKDPSTPRQLDLASVLKKLAPLLENPDIRKIGQNIKYDCLVLSHYGIQVKGILFDTMIASYLLEPAKRVHGLDQIALDYLNHKTITFEEVTGQKGKKTKDKKGAVTFADVPIAKAAPYACEDADITLMAYQLFAPKLEENGYTQLFETVEMPLVPVLMRMEQNGISVDEERLHELTQSFKAQLATIEQEIYTLAGESFNINSSQQLGAILFDKLKLPVQKKTKKKTGYSTDIEVLTALSAKHPLPAYILRHRTLTKLTSTYTDSLLDLINPKTKRIHTSYNQTITVTGRLSSSEPNLQNIPIRTEEGREIRKAFVPREGWTFIAADYSQIELRILAHCADDPLLIDAFQKNEDIHARTATEVFQVLPGMMTKELRRQAKAINFGIIYGMSAFGLSKDLGISRKMAQTYIDHYFERYKGVRNFIDATLKNARKTGKTSTLLGRVRMLPDINSANKNVRQFAERTAVNTMIQGTAADLIKLAMIRTDQVLTQRNLSTVMILSVHDEIVLEAPEAEKETVIALIEETMEGVWDLKVPLKVNVASGENWAMAHD